MLLRLKLIGLSTVVLC